jgi:excisionase family DNA binding protein
MHFRRNFFKNKLNIGGEIMEDVLYTVAEVSKLIKTNPAYVYQLIKAGLLPVLKLGSYKVRREALLNFLKKYEGKDLTDPENIVDL